MYEDLNDLWLHMRKTEYSQIESKGVSEFFYWVKLQSHQFRGVTFGTMLRDEGYQFIRLGTFMERADNTARILDVKYHTLLPSVSDVGGASITTSGARPALGERPGFATARWPRCDYADESRRAADPA
jgi:uncharacterized alpha-E superfamily protein